MPLRTDNYDWETFLGRRQISGDAAKIQAAHAGKTILLTGAGGSIGSALAKRIVLLGARRVLLLESSEQNLYQIHSDLEGLASGASHIPILGDIADSPLMDATLERFQPEIIYHAAAFKHVPLMEANPLAAIRNNTLGTHALALTAARYAVEKLIMISTDKAVDPQSVMGVSKRVAELALMTLSTEKTRMSSIRLGNVLGSQGSVGQLFLQQISRGGPVTVTHPEVRRYFLTLRETVDLILTSGSLDSSGGIWIPELGSPAKVLDLAEHLIRHAGLTPGDDIPITFIGMRPGDKMTETLVSSRESREETAAANGLHRIAGPKLSREDLEFARAQLTEILRRRDLADLIHALGKIVPEYQPSNALLAMAKDLEIKTHHA